MKKALSFVLVLMLVSGLLVFTASAEGANLFVNGDFNSAALGYWWMRGDWNGGTWEYSNNGGFEDSGCLIVTGFGGGAASCNAGLFYTSQEGNETTFEPVANEQYQLSFMVNFLDGTNNDVYVDINEGALGSGHANHTGGWEKVSFTFTAPSADPIKIRCVVNALDDGKRVAIDEMSLISLSGNHQPDDAASAGSSIDKETQLLGDNLLDNGEFNKASISKWWCRTDWNGGYFTWTQTGGVDDSGCLMAIGAGEGTPACNAGVFYTGSEGVENYLQLTPGKTYQVDCSFFKPEDVKGSFYIDINEGKCGAGMCTKNGEWDSASFRFLAPEEPIKIRIVANALQPGQNVYVDNVMLREVGATPTEKKEETVIDSSIPTIQPAVTENKKAEESETSQPEAEKEVKKDSSATAYIFGGVTVAAIAAVFLAVLGKKKKNKKNNETQEEKKND